MKQQVTNTIKAIETDSMTKAGHMIKVEVILGILGASEAGTILELT